MSRVMKPHTHIGRYVMLPEDADWKDRQDMTGWVRDDAERICSVLGIPIKRIKVHEWREFVSVLSEPAEYISWHAEVTKEEYEAPGFREKLEALYGEEAQQ